MDIIIVFFKALPYEGIFLIISTTPCVKTNNQGARLISIGTYEYSRLNFSIQGGNDFNFFALFRPSDRNRISPSRSRKPSIRSTFSSRANSRIFITEGPSRGSAILGSSIPIFIRASCASKIVLTNKLILLLQQLRNMFHRYISFLQNIYRLI